MKPEVREILDRLRQSSHRGGSFASEVLADLVEYFPDPLVSSLETGCGKSTVVFSVLSDKHYVFAYDDRESADSSVSMVVEDEQYRPDNVEWVFGPTQKTIPRYDFPEGTRFDVILLDGPHGYPYPDLEYACLFEYLRPGGLLILDDIHIPSINNMFMVLREDRMYEEIAVVSTTGILRRTSSPGIPATGDHWYEQGYNISRFPLSVDRHQKDRIRFDCRYVFPAKNTALFQKVGFFESYQDNCLYSCDTKSSISFCVAAAPGIEQGIKVEVEYSSVYPDSLSHHAATIGDTIFALPATRDPIFYTCRIKYRGRGNINVAFLNSEAIAEHDRGNRRYDFRRLAMRIHSIRVSSDTIKHSGSFSDQSPTLKDTTAISGKPRLTLYRRLIKNIRKLLGIQSN